MSNIGERQGEIIIVEPLAVPVPQKHEEPVRPKYVEEPELVPVRKD